MRVRAYVACACRARACVRVCVRPKYPKYCIRNRLLWLIYIDISSINRLSNWVQGVSLILPRPQLSDISVLGCHFHRLLDDLFESLMRLTTETPWRHYTGLINVWGILRWSVVCLQKKVSPRHNQITAWVCGFGVIAISDVLLFPNSLKKMTSLFALTYIHFKINMDNMFWVTQLNVFSNMTFISKTQFDITVY